MCRTIGNFNNVINFYHIIIIVMLMMMLIRTKMKIIIIIIGLKLELVKDFEYNYCRLVGNIETQNV